MSDAAAPLATPATAGEDAVIAAGLRVALRVMLSRFSGLQETDAQDLAQELAVEYWQHRDGIRSPEGWFRACAVRKAQRFLDRRRPSAPLDRAVNVPSSQPAPRELALQQIFFTLHSRCRRLLGLVVIAGCRPEELASSEDPTGRAVYRRTAQCLKVLRTRWLRVSGMRGVVETRAS